MKLLSHAQLRLLESAVDDAAAWRGSLLSRTTDVDEANKEFAALENFDRRIEKMRNTLIQVKAQQRFIRSVTQNQKD
jgi:hypothetical protein